MCFNYPLVRETSRIKAPDGFKAPDGINTPGEITVAAAVIERSGRILIGQRKSGSKHALKWEFPGGKLEAGETPVDALARELQEELAISAVIGEEMARYAVRYPGGPLTHLLFYRVTEFTGEPQNLVFEQIAWESRDALLGYDFLEGDVAFFCACLQVRPRDEEG